MPRALTPAFLPRCSPAAVRKHVWLLTDMLMVGSREGAFYGIEKTVALATCNIKTLENTGRIRNAFTVYTGDGEFTFASHTLEDRDSWVQDMGRCIAAAATDSYSGSGAVTTVNVQGGINDTAGAAERIRQRLMTKAGGAPQPPPPAHASFVPPVSAPRVATQSSAGRGDVRASPSA